MEKKRKETGGKRKKREGKERERKGGGTAQIFTWTDAYARHCGRLMRQTLGSNQEFTSGKGVFSPITFVPFFLSLSSSLSSTAK